MLACMRTTVEITETQRRALADLAGRRGLRGFSPLVREAIDRYLESLRGDEVRELLALRGSVNEEDAAEVRRRIDSAWETWRTGS